MTSQELCDLVERWIHGNKDGKKEVIRALMYMKRSEIVRFAVLFMQDSRCNAKARTLYQAVEREEEFEDPIKRIHDILYLDQDLNPPHAKEFYNLDKAWDMDILDMIADVVDSVIPKPEKVEGQDREGYTDNQDRKNYTTEGK